jgi:hypothetical protein
MDRSSSTAGAAEAAALLRREAAGGDVRAAAKLLALGLLATAAVGALPIAPRAGGDFVAAAALLGAGLLGVGFALRLLWLVWAVEWRHSAHVPPAQVPHPHKRTAHPPVLSHLGRCAVG